jgi:hypothetical protein
MFVPDDFERFRALSDLVVRWLDRRVHRHRPLAGRYAG